jgi:hypothetical protein
MMQIDIENAFINVSWTVISKKLQNVERVLANIVPFYQAILWCSFFSLLLTWVAWSKGHHYLIIFKHKARWPLKGHLFALAHYWTLLKTIVQAFNCVFQSLMDNTHIGGPMNEIVLAFDHLLTQLTLVGLRIKVSKCKLWSPLRISSKIEIPQSYILVTNSLHILGVLMVFQDFVTHFWMRLHFRMWRILMIFFSWEKHKLIWAFCLHVSLVNLFISFGQYLLLPSYIFW